MKLLFEEQWRQDRVFHLTFHHHLNLCESIGLAAEVAHGSCTDLPPSKK
jgi:hypothetical protein